MKELVILKIGGSILSPKDTLFDFSIARKIKSALMPLTNKYQFILSIGGGALARMYQELTKKNGGSEQEIHWAGTSACNHNAVMMRVALRSDAEDIAITGEAVNDTNKIEFDKPFLVVGAARPGHSSDYDAVLMAKRSGAKRIISLKNVDGVYSDDPKKNPEAQKYDSLTWDQYRNEILATDAFTPKMASPVDPVASKHAQEDEITFIILDGSDLPNIVNAIQGNSFNGTTIHP